MHLVGHTPVGLNVRFRNVYARKQPSRFRPTPDIGFASVEVLGWVKLSPPARPFKGQLVATMQTFGSPIQVRRDCRRLREVRLLLPSVLPARNVGKGLKRDESG
jgi:hypothetical protein